MIISEQSVELLDFMGTDLSVVNAARVSFAKESEWDSLPNPWYERLDQPKIEGKSYYNPTYKDIISLSNKDEKLIKYLAEHNHWSPFSHTSLSFRIKAPIFVARQLGKHQVGLAWNEVSRRYVDSEPEFYFPKIWRKKADNVKQGSSDEPLTDDWIFVLANSLITDSHNTYMALLQEGLCPEQARMILPQNMMTEWIWTGSLYAFARVCNLRLDSHTQKECRDVAKLIYNIIKDLFPVSVKYLIKNE